jgi:hypothetical protein
MPGCDRGGDDNEHPKEAHDMQILTGNHRFDLKNNRIVNRTKTLSFH